MRRVIALLMVMLPSSLKRPIGRLVFGWDIHPTAYLGPSLRFFTRLTMGPGSSIGPGNVIRGIEELRLDEGAQIAERNWISGFRLGFQAFDHSPNRHPDAIPRRYAEIMVGHKVDGTAPICGRCWSSHTTPPPPIAWCASTRRSPIRIPPRRNTPTSSSGASSKMLAATNKALPLHPISHQPAPAFGQVYGNTLSPTTRR